VLPSVEVFLHTIELLRRTADDLFGQELALHGGQLSRIPTSQQRAIAPSPPHVCYPDTANQTVDRNTRDDPYTVREAIVTVCGAIHYAVSSRMQ
jgi:hypothetical protein